MNLARYTCRLAKPILQSARKMSTKSQVVQPLSNRFYLFNYFEKPNVEEKTFVDHWREVADYVKHQDHFISTHLHNATCDKARFQWINFAVFDSDDICVFGKPDPNWRNLMMKGNEAGLAPYPGKYQEIASYQGNDLKAENVERPEEYRFLVTGILAEESVTDHEIESNWASWSGADYLQKELNDKKSLGDSLFYKFLSGPKPLIRYTVRTELTGISDEEGNELAEKMNEQEKPKGVQTHTGLYKVLVNLFHEKK